MGKQYNKVEKRNRRRAYLKRKKDAAKAARAKPVTAPAPAEGTLPPITEPPANTPAAPTAESTATPVLTPG
jgi:hypothetical protein